MKDTDYNKLVELTLMNGHLIPSNQNAIDLISNMRDGEKTYVSIETSRDISLHRCYFSLLNYIWLWMPQNFKDKISSKYFYKFIKIIQGEFDVVFEFKDGIKMIEYKSIAFGNMSNERFREFVKEQISIIYNDIIYPTFNKNTEMADHIISEIENEYEKFLNKL